VNTGGPPTHSLVVVYIYLGCWCELQGVVLESLLNSVFGGPGHAPKIVLKGVWVRPSECHG
jgi:hypothetical protein